MDDAPCCSQCGKKSMGWGWTERWIWIPLADGEKPVRRRLLVKRFRCRHCNGGRGRTWCHLPPVLLWAKRYAAQLVQRCWEVWAEGDSYEKTSEACHVRSVRTVQRWLQPLAEGAQHLKAAVRLLLVGEDQLETEKPDAEHSKRRPAASELLDLTRRLMSQARLDPTDRDRVPFHFVIAAAGKA